MRDVRRMIGRKALLERVRHVQDTMQRRKIWRERGGSRDLVAEVKAKKARTKELLATYDHHPKLAVVVTSFNQVWNVPNLASRLLTNPYVDEVVVSEDGSIDGSLEAWVERLEGPNQFLIRSNDLHEIRSLDRALRLSRADICCIVQDDDVVPEDPEWAKQVLDLFERHPRLGVVGGFIAFEEPPADEGDTEEPTLEYWAHIRWTGDEFRFVPTVSVGPYYVRAECYRELGGFDTSFSAPGQAGVGFDEEFGLRAWLHGWEVGYVHQPFKTGEEGKYVAAGGTFLYGEASERTTHDVENKRKIAIAYGRHHDTIVDLVARSNERLASAE